MSELTLPTHHTTASRPSAPARDTRPPGFGRLVRIELRKSLDTRAGRWLLAGVAAIGIAMTFLAALAGHAKDHTFHQSASSIQGGMAVLLPVVSILLVTSEWSQHTALQTFVLTPHRGRVAAAKLAAGAVLALTVAGFGIALSALATQFAGTHPPAGEWRQAGVIVLASLVVQLLSQLSGMGFGLLLLNSPAAIVANFVIPIAWAALAGSTTGLHGVQPWLDPAKATENLLGGHMDAHHWAQVGTVVLVWVVALNTAGLARLRRKDIT
jgi:ABC-2 type transport system permease protein